MGDRVRAIRGLSHQVVVAHDIKCGTQALFRVFGTEGVEQPGLVPGVRLSYSNVLFQSGDIAGGWVNGEATGDLAALPKLPHSRVSSFDMTPISVGVE